MAHPFVASWSVDQSIAKNLGATACWARTLNTHLAQAADLSPKVIQSRENSRGKNLRPTHLWARSREHRGYALSWSAAGCTSSALPLGETPSLAQAQRLHEAVDFSL